MVQSGTFYKALEGLEISPAFSCKQIHNDLLWVLCVPLCENQRPVKWCRMCPPDPNPAVPVAGVDCGTRRLVQTATSGEDLRFRALHYLQLPREGKIHLGNLLERGGMLDTTSPLRVNCDRTMAIVSDASLCIVQPVSGNVRTLFSML
ncbi:hypothetical protein RRG08_022384 [Elysia crispata]|uniref:Uncharacterized protein n=1 Tax=Elysia crispata TaxID=231223 RepID=A0AAE0Z337_9GAST|nr:hypothetical protein RRG08_022384 [Elysia crispata]